jgi:phospholipid/cholesterol/gamma-HCH transport system substrate-binding protein
MEPKRKRAVTVGIFIALALVLFIIGILTLGGQQNMFAKGVSVRAVFKDVGGLQAGNNIWYAGVKVGVVKEINLNGAGGVEVVMSIQEKSKEFIRRDVKAKLGSEGLIGNKIVVLFGGTAAQPPVKNGDVVAVETAMSTEEMMATLQENNQNLLSITTDFKNLSRGISEGKGTIGRLLTDESLVNQFEATAVSLRQASLNAQRLSADVADYAAQLQKPGSMTSNLIKDTVIFARLRAATRQVDELTRTANAMASNLDAASREITAGLSNNSSPAGVFLHDEKAAADIQAMLRNLNTGTKKLDENLEALQHNFLLRGFFKKRRKAEEKAVEDSIKQVRRMSAGKE